QFGSRTYLVSSGSISLSATFLHEGTKDHEAHEGTSPVSLDQMMAAAQRRLASGTQIVQQAADILRPLILLPRVIHHDHRRAVARPEAFDLEERERAAGVGLTRLDLQRAAD